MESRTVGSVLGRWVGSSLLAGGLAAVPCVAQASPKGDSPPVPAASLRQACGVNEVDGAVWGGGADYKVRFGPGEVEFTPALGRQAAHNLPLSFSTLSIARGADAQPAAAVAPRRVGARTVEYDRAPGVVERHEVRADGLELSFEFASRPAGTGDLVVRLQLRSALPMELSDTGLGCEQPGIGGVGVGLVTGLDAAGRSAPGQLRLDGDVLELSLPAAFIDTAALPLVLDPFVYPVIPIGLDSPPDFWPDIAYEAGADRFVVVWGQVYSSSDDDIRGQFVDSNGALDPLGFWLVEVASDTLADYPAVASLAKASRFLVVWDMETSSSSELGLYGRSISTIGFGMSSTILLDADASYFHLADVGGHSSPVVDVVSVVWYEDGQVLHRNVTVPFASNPTAAASVQILVPDSAAPAAISKSGGDSRRLMVVCPRSHLLGGQSQWDVDATLIDETGAVLWGPEALMNTPASETRVDVDGDGTVFFTTYLRSAPPPNDSYDTVRVARTVLGGGGFQTIDTLIDDQSAFGLGLEWPRVAYTGNGAVIAWLRQYDELDWDLPVVAVDSWANTIADPVAYVDFTIGDSRELAVCSMYSANHGLGDGVLCAYGLVDWPTFGQDMLAAVVDPELGIVTDMGGASAQGGHASVSAATVGNSGFTHFYDGLYGFNSVTLLIGLSPLSAPFCTGTLIPNPIQMLHLGTKADSTLVLPTPMPNNPALLGLTIYEQYAESDPFTPPCAKNLQLSNGLAITFE